MQWHANATQQRLMGHDQHAPANGWHTAGPDENGTGHKDARQTQYTEMLSLVDAVSRQEVSQAALQARDALCSLDPAEGLGVVAWLVQAMMHNAPPEHANSVQQWIQDLSVFADFTSKPQTNGRHS